MSETIETILYFIVFAAVFFLLPFLILIIRDRAGFVGSAIQIAMGTLALIIGTILACWMIYNLFNPTPEFRESLGSELGFNLGILNYAYPLCFLTIGWRWLTNQEPGIEEQKIDIQTPELIDSLNIARKTLPFFVEQVRDLIDGNHFIRFPFRVASGKIEWIWAEVNFHGEDGFNVLIGGRKHFPHRIWARCNIPETEVLDWKIVQSDGRIRGGFTMIGAIRHMENKSLRLNRTIKKQKAQLIDFDSSILDQWMQAEKVTGF